MFVDRKEVSAPAREQCGQKESASPDRHGVDMMFFVADVEIMYTLVCTTYGATVFVT
jgi:hypothetical protein